MTSHEKLRYLPPSPSPPHVSIVIPVFNEREVLPLLFARLDLILASLDLTHEILTVDDGSRDGSSAYLSQLATRRADLRHLRLSRNFGKEAAISAGLDHASGAAVILLDADLQDPPELIPLMIAAFHEGADVVSMKRRSRAGESWLKRGTAYLFYRVLQRMTRFEVPPDTGDFRLLSRRAVEALQQLPERNRYMKGLFAWIGLPTRVIEYDREPRVAGQTKWDLLALTGLALEGITSFSTTPLRWATAVGLVAAALGGFFGLWIVIKTLVLGNLVEGYPSLIAIITFLGGVQLLSIGIVGEYVGKTYFESKQRPLYLVESITPVSPPGPVPTMNTMSSSHV